MRKGDFAVEVVPRGKGVGVREVGSGHVLARPGQVYALRLRNFGPLRCVADVHIDGRLVTAGGLVIDAWCTEELERPISPDENGRFTVVAEGDERVFGPDGGRDNDDLGLIEVRFRRELPAGPERPRPLPPTIADSRDHRPAWPMPGRPERPEPEYPQPRIWAADNGLHGNRSDRFGGHFEELTRSLYSPAEQSTPAGAPDIGDIERAAGTGLTGQSNQRFVATQLGPLEKETTVIQLRLVIAAEEAIAATPPLTEERTPPVRPAARP